MSPDAAFGLAALYICGFAWCLVVGGLAAQSNAAHAGRMVARAILSAPVWPVALPLLLMWMGRPASWWPSVSAASAQAELSRLRLLREDDRAENATLRDRLIAYEAELAKLRAEREGYR